MSINIAWYQLEPYLMKVRDLDNKTRQGTRYTGRDYKVLEELAKALNFSLNFLPFAEFDKVRFSSRRNIFCKKIL